MLSVIDSGKEEGWNTAKRLMLAKGIFIAMPIKKKQNMMVRLHLALKVTKFSASAKSATSWTNNPGVRNTSIFAGMLPALVSEREYSYKAAATTQSTLLHEVNLHISKGWCFGFPFSFFNLGERE